MGSRQYVAHSVTGCSGNGKTVANLLAVVFFLLFVILGQAKDLLWPKLAAARE
jgi:hypothetical protein